MIVWFQNLLTWFFGAVVPMTQLQSDLYSFLLGLAGVVPIEDRSAGIDRAGRSAVVDERSLAKYESVASRLRLVLVLAGVPACRWPATPRLQRSEGLRHPFSARRAR